MGIQGVKPDQGLFTTTAGGLLTLATTFPTTATASGSVTVSSSAYTALPSIAAIVSELLAQGGWASGDAMSFIITGATTGTVLDYYSYAEGTGKYEELSITYTAGATSTAGILPVLGLY